MAAPGSFGGWGAPPAPAHAPGGTKRGRTHAAAPVRQVTPPEAAARPKRGRVSAPGPGSALGLELLGAVAAAPQAAAPAASVPLPAAFPPVHRTGLPAVGAGTLRPTGPLHGGAAVRSAAEDEARYSAPGGGPGTRGPQTGPAPTAPHAQSAPGRHAAHLAALPAVPAASAPWEGVPLLGAQADTFISTSQQTQGMPGYARESSLSRGSLGTHTSWAPSARDGRENAPTPRAAPGAGLHLAVGLSHSGMGVGPRSPSAASERSWSDVRETSYGTVWDGAFSPQGGAGPPARRAFPPPPAAAYTSLPAAAPGAWGGPPPAVAAAAAGWRSAVPAPQSALPGHAAGLAMATRTGPVHRPRTANTLLRKEAERQRQQLPPQFRGARVLSYQPTERRWLTVYTEYRTRRQVRLYGPSAVGVCLRRDWSRLSSGIRPRTGNANGKCTWITLVFQDMFRAFCAFRPLPGGRDGNGKFSDDMVWTGPTPDELDAAAERLGLLMDLDNWAVVAEEAAAGAPPAHHAPAPAPAFWPAPAAPYAGR